MQLPSQRAPFFLGAAAALMLVFSTATVYPAFAQTATPEPTPKAGAAATPSAPTTDKSADGSGQHAGRSGASGNSDQFLADALGITTDKLNAAYLKAANAALDQAVAGDLLTQTQADTMRRRLESASGNGFPLHLGGRGFNLFGSDQIDGEALLADALGISTDELQGAYDKADAAALAQAVTDGQLTQEQANLVAARRALQEYWATQQQSYAEIVQAAVDAGAITQEQADLLLQNQQSLGGHGFGRGDDFGLGMGGHGMMPGMGGHGMMPGMGGHGMMPGMGGHGMMPGMGGHGMMPGMGGHGMMPGMGGRGDQGGMMPGMGGHGLHGDDNGSPDTQPDSEQDESSS